MLQDQPVPTSEVTVSPTGGASITVTVPPVGPGPTLLMVAVYVVPVWPWKKLPMWLLEIVRSGASTLIVAVAVFPVPAFAALTLPVVLTFVPGEVAVTLMLKEQEPLAAIVPPARLTLCAPEGAETVPVPQAPARPLGVATTMPAGKASVNARPVIARVAFAFVIVKVREVEPERPNDAAPKDFAILGAVATVRVADAAFPVPPLVDVTLPVMLVKFPAVLPVTLTLNVQEPLAAIDAPDRLTVPDPTVAVVVPPHELLSPFGAAMVIPAGRTSVNATPANATVFAAGFVIVKLSPEMPFGEMPAGVNAFEIEGGATTEILAEAVPPIPPCVEATFPVVLFCVPAAVPVTLTEKVHEVLLANVAPLRLITFVPAASVTVPAPQVPLWPLGVAITSPVGNVSVNPTPLSAEVALLF
jgi:hypothetical protein